MTLYYNYFFINIFYRVIKYKSFIVNKVSTLSVIYERQWKINAVVPQEVLVIVELVIMSSIILHVTHLEIMSLFPKLFNLNGPKYYQHMSCVKQ